MKQVKVDLTYIKSIAGDDDGFIREMLLIYLTNAPYDMDSIEKYLQEKNYEMMSSFVHKIKAPIQMLGDEETTDLVGKLELMTKKVDDFEKVSQLFEQLKHRSNLLNQEVNVILTEYNAKA